MVDPVVDAGQLPSLPPGRLVELPDRGVTFIRQLSGPPDAVPVVLLHGWTATADLNWFTCFDALARHHPVVAMDLRGHGQGVRSQRIFRLEDCADDVAALADSLGWERVVVIGYSMGGTVAQLTWHRHPDRVHGLVLCATASAFAASRGERRSFFVLSVLAALARVTPTPMRRWLSHRMYLQRRAAAWEPWALEQVARHDWRAILEAGRALGSFRSDPWLAEIDAPTAVIVTLRDPIVPAERQIRLVEAIPGATAFRIDGEHDAVVARADRFVPLLVEACRSVAEPIPGLVSR